MRHRQPTRGFTLLELLVAIAVFATLSVMAYGALREVMASSAHVEAEVEKLARLQLTFTWLERDLAQAIGRPVRDAYGDHAHAMLGGDLGTELLLFTRAGHSNPAQSARRSSLLRVGYRLDEKRFSRVFWPVVDAVQGTEPVQRELLDNVNSVSLRFLNHSVAWQPSWPTDIQSSALTCVPAAVEVTLDVDGLGEVRRLIRTPPAERVIQGRLVTPPC